MTREPRSSYEPNPPPTYRGQAYVVLGRTGLRASRVALGAMTFGAQTDEAESARMVAACLDRGINFFDTANTYGSGASETVLGRVLGGRRDEAILATKARYPMSDDPNDAGLSRTNVLRACEESLRRLGTDHVDLYYLHAPDDHTDLDEALLALDILVRQGKVRYPALSNFAAWQHAEALWRCDRRDYPPPLVTQPVYNVLARGIEAELLPFCRTHRIATCVYNPLCGGLLTGKHVREGSPEPGSRFDASPMYRARYWRDEYFDAVERLSGVARDAGMSLVELSLRWVLGRPGVDCLLLGASRLEQLEENLRATDRGALPDDVARAADEVWPLVQAVAPKYNR